MFQSTHVRAGRDNEWYGGGRNKEYWIFRSETRMMAWGDSDGIRLESVRRIVSQRGRVADKVRPTVVCVVDGCDRVSVCIDRVGYLAVEVMLAGIEQYCLYK